MHDWPGCRFSQRSVPEAFRSAVKFICEFVIVGLFAIIYCQSGWLLYDFKKSQSLNPALGLVEIASRDV